MQSIRSTLNAIWNEACLHSLACVALSISLSLCLYLYLSLYLSAPLFLSSSSVCGLRPVKPLPSLFFLVRLRDFSCRRLQLSFNIAVTLLVYVCVCVCVSQTHITSHTTQSIVSQSSSSWPTVDHQRKCSSPFLVHFLKVRTFPFGINDSPTRTDDTPPPLMRPQSFLLFHFFLLVFLCVVYPVGEDEYKKVF